jgi:hypothetical protein
VPGEARDILRALVEAEGADLEKVSFAVSLLGPARVLAPLMVRRYRDGTLACMVEWNPSSNTSCAFLVASKSSARPLSLRDQVVYLHPYGKNVRVRGGTALGNKILGRGETWWDGDTFFAANLTAEEEQRKGGPRFVLGHALPAGSTLLWEVNLGPDAPPRLGGKPVAPPPPPPGPKPPGPKPPPPKPPPPPEPPAPKPPKPGPELEWWHVVLSDDTSNVIVRVSPPSAKVELLRIVPRRNRS